MHIELPLKMAQQVLLEYGSLEAYADKFRKFGFETVTIDVR